MDETKILGAKNLIAQMKLRGPYASIHDAEFKVFSQFGDDGIIQYLIHHCAVDSDTFIEFGVANYTESNTRFLLMNDNWRGLVIDSDQKYVEQIKREELYWKHDLTARCEFVTRENINHIISSNGFAGNIGLLSIDVDGNDYWIWECINVIEPTIVICEYNSVFGVDNSITVPYDASFECAKAHYSYLYWGCSLRALCFLAAKKSYSFIGCDSHGNNAYFVRTESLRNVEPMTIEKGYVRSKFRESRDTTGQLSFVTGDERLRLIASMPVFDVETELVRKL